jgi:dienelactone hydrolase
MVSISLRLFAVAVAAAAAGASLGADSCAAQDASHVQIIPINTITVSDSEALLGKNEGPATTIAGQLRIPRSQVSKFPVVLLVHGRGGISLSHELWANQLNKLGIATFSLDSYGGRRLAAGFKTDRPLAPFATISDVYRALDVLAQHPRIDSEKIVLMGFGSGAIPALYGRLERFRKAFSSGDAHFAAFIGFYTPCNISLLDEDQASQSPVRLFHGSADDWLPIVSCKEHVAKLAAAKQDIQLKEYPGAYNSFDNPDFTHSLYLGQVQTGRDCHLEERVRGDLINRDTGKTFSPSDACVQTGVTLAYNREVTLAARKDVGEFLTSLFHMVPPPDK